jgi:hypothetical protein
MKILPDRNVGDYNSRKSFAKKPRLGPHDSKTSRIWKKCKNGKRKYGWRLWVYSPRAYVLRWQGEMICIVSPQTFANIESGKQSKAPIFAAAKKIDRLS